jgi:biotin synthase
VFLHLEVLVREIKKQEISVSVSCQPVNSQDIRRLKNAGVDCIGIALDAVTEEIFCKIKGADGGGVYSWWQEISLLNDALFIFGAGRVSTHLIIGLGESEKDVTILLQWCVDMGILSALFAFTPIQGTALEKRAQPDIGTYRRLQLARYLLIHGIARLEHITFDAEGKIVSFGVDPAVLEEVINRGEPFQTSGCLNCNRPFYNEKPGGPLYNYPKKLSIKEVEEVKDSLSKLF